MINPFMKTFYLIIIIFFLPIQLTGQVGINTTLPTNTLDVNGTLRVRNTASASPTDAALYIDASGIVKKLNNSTPVRQIWGVIRLNANNSVSVINPGSGGWTVSYISIGTAMINIASPFSSIPTALAIQYLTATNSTTTSSGFPPASVIDNSGVDHASHNQVQVWASDSNSNRSNGNRYVSFVIIGF